MNTSTNPSALSHPAELPLAGKTVLRLLQRLTHGSLTLGFPDGSSQRFGAAHSEGHNHASLVLRNWNLFGAALKSGDIGFAESYMAGDWTTPDLAALLNVLIANRTHLESAVYGHWWGRAVYQIRHWLNRNNKTNSRKNIHAHYDLGNAFYTAWLDSSMNYSSAWFDGDDHRSLTDAQQAKVRRALRSCGVQPGDRVLEIGCGWGALAEMATVEQGAHITGVTLSTEQLAFAQERLERVGTAQQADLRLQDYRDITPPAGGFDAICSIEMLEAVGQAYWPTYFSAVHRLLKPGGRACIQSIVIRDDLFDRYVSSTDFIQQYIFPGGCLPSPQAFRAAARQAGLQVVDELAFGQDYALTLRHWRDRFTAEQSTVRALGFDERFQRVWELYLAYCEAAFTQRNTDVMQFTLQRPH
jgi:cyclopropane-fatty-acyl-phospholipid synthase